MTSDQFSVRYPEFDTIDPDFVGAVLAEVGFQLDAALYGNRFDSAHGALAAHRIYISPYGSSLRGDSKQSDTSDYLKLFNQIRWEVDNSALVASSCPRGW